MIDASTGAQLWAQNLARSAPKITAGVNAVAQSPTAKAAQNLQKASQNYQDAVNSGRMANALNAVSLQDWKNAMLTTGLSRIQSGAQKGQSKYQDFATKFYPVAAQVSQQVQQMPKNTLEDSLARVGAVMRAFRQWAGKSPT